MHICVVILTIIGTDNGLSPGRHQAIIWTNDGMMLTELLVTEFSEILIKIHTFSLKKMHLKMSLVKWRPFCLGLNVLKSYVPNNMICYQLITNSSATPSTEHNASPSWTGSTGGTLTPSSPEQNGRHFADDIFRWIFVNEIFCILIKISLKFVPKDMIDNNPALVQIMAWRRIGDKPLSEPMLIKFPTHICGTKGEMC